MDSTFLLKSLVNDMRNDDDLDSFEKIEIAEGFINQTNEIIFTHILDSEELKEYNEMIGILKNFIKEMTE